MSDFLLTRTNTPASAGLGGTGDPGCGGPGFNNLTISQIYTTAPNTPWAKNGTSPTFNQYHTPVPTNYQYSLTVEREFLRDFAASVAYVGNKGTHLNTSALDIVKDLPALGRGVRRQPDSSSPPAVVPVHPCRPFASQGRNVHHEVTVVGQLHSERVPTLFQNLCEFTWYRRQSWL